jgi:hypothetical protein
VNVFLPIRQGQALPKHLVAAAGCVALVLIAAAARAESALAVAEQKPKVSLAESQPSSPPARLPGIIGDVVLRPGGVLEGRVVCPEGRANGATVAGLPVVLLRAAQTIATTVTDAQGEFTFGNLRGGLYRVVIPAADGPHWRFCRLWTPQAAPPQASDRVSVLLGHRLIRGQSPFRRLPGGATVAAIAAGAIVPPIIYYSVKKDEYIPASP